MVKLVQDNKFVKSLIEKVKSKNSQSFEQLFQIFGNSIYALCLRLTADVTSANELTSKTFVTAWQNSAFIRDDAPFAMWLTGIAINQYLENLYFTKEHDDELKEVAPAISLMLEKVRIEESLFILPDAERVAIVLHILEKYSADESADLLKISPSDFSALLMKALNDVNTYMHHMFTRDELILRLSELREQIAPVENLWQEVFAFISNEREQITQAEEEAQKKQEKERTKLPKVKSKKKIKSKDEKKKYAGNVSINKSGMFKKVLLILIPVFIIAAAYLIMGGSSWQINSFSGRVALSGKSIDKSTSIDDGNFVTTGENSACSIVVPDVGVISLLSNSTVRKKDDLTIDLISGKLDLDKSAARKKFTVRLNDNVINDYNVGGKYYIDRQEESTIIYNRKGWVSVQGADVIFMIPERYICEIDHREGAGIPFNNDAPDEYKKFLIDYRFSSTDKDSLSQKILKNSKPRDFISLWNLMRISSPEIRADIYDYFSSLFSIPDYIPRDGIVNLDEETMAAFMLHLDKLR